MSRTITTHSTIAVTLTNPADNPVLVAGSGAIDSGGAFAIYGTAPTAWTITNS